MTVSLTSVQCTKASLFLISLAVWTSLEETSRATSSRYHLSLLWIPQGNVQTECNALGVSPAAAVEGLRLQPLRGLRDGEDDEGEAVLRGL